MSWSQILIADKPADLFVPFGATTPTGIVMFLHGYDGVTIKDNKAYTDELSRYNLIGLCPHGSHCWWTDQPYPPFDQKISPIDFLSQQVAAFCQEQWQISTPRIAVCGVEMGGQGALQLGYRHARQFPVVVAISPKVDFEAWWGHGTSLDVMFTDRENARQRTAILHLHPLNYPKYQFILCDPTDHYSFDGVLTLASKLSSTGIPFDHDFESSHGGYGWNYANAMASKVIDFIAKSIAQV